MKLLFAPASPFVRKVRVVAYELGMHERIQLEAVELEPTLGNSRVTGSNPLGKIPALELDAQRCLYDSRVIVEYLNGVSRERKVIPAQTAARIAALRREALADGMLDAAVLCRYESVCRPQSLRWENWVVAQMQKVRRGIAALELEVDEFAAQPMIGEIAVACALGYLDFRFPEENWRPAHPKLHAWYAAFATRASMLQTAPSLL